MEGDGLGALVVGLSVGDIVGDFIGDIVGDIIGDIVGAADVALLLGCIDGDVELIGLCFIGGDVVVEFSSNVISVWFVAFF